MKKSNEKPNTNCDSIQRLLVKKTSDELTSDESLLVGEHLKSCARCQSYQRTLLNLQDSMEISAQEKLVPDPAIRENLIQRMRIQRSQKAGILSSTWRNIRSMLQYRIPIYQPLSGLVVIALIFLMVSHLSFSPDQEPLESQGLAQIQTPTPVQMSVVDNLDIIGRQKIGRNVKEDTTLTRFIVTSM